MIPCKQTSQADDIFLSSRQVRVRYGNVSEMWLWRREHEEGSDFPRPVKIHKRRFWRLSNLTAWERRLASGAAPLRQEGA
jgi:predicted DNA-binding transcriptional regulator AlpA